MDATAELVQLSKVGRLINSPSPPHISTVMRWALRGVGQPPVKLATVKVGGRRFTTAAAIEAFIAATSGQPSETPHQRAHRRDVAIERAEHQLDADGVN